MKNLLAKLFVALFVLVGSPAFSVAKAASTVAFIRGRCGSCGNRVQARRYATHSVYLNRGHVHVTLTGDGDTDLDLYVYDLHGHLIERQEGNSDKEVACLNVYRSGYFIVKVVNRGGVYNDYRITTQ